MKNNKALEIICIAAISVLAFGLRLYHLNAPLADWHSWRQSDTAAVARNFLRFGIDPLHPRYDDLSNIQSGKDNPNGWRMVEFPLYQVVAALLKTAFGAFPIEVWLRLVNAAASAGSAVLLWFILRARVDRVSGMLAAFVYAVLPYGVFYGRAILPDTFMVFWGLLCLGLLAQEKRGTVVLTLAAGGSAAIALLAKPMAVFLILPAYYLLWRRYGTSKLFVIHAVIFSLVSVLPVIAWRSWITRFPEGIPVSAWLLNQGNIRFKGAWFYWLFQQRIGNLILGVWGLVPLGAGLLAGRAGKDRYFLPVWLSGGLLYLIIFAAGNVQHDYYQILLVPMLAAVVGVGLAQFFAVKPRNVGQMALGLVSVAFMLAFSWYTIRTYYWINRPEIVEAGKAADAVLPKNAKVIAPYNGDTTFLYQTGRQGWPLGFDIDKKIEMGATAYVTVSPTDSDTETRDLARTYTVLVRNDRFAIIDLTRPLSVSQP